MTEKIVIEQDGIDAFEETAAAFMRDVLGFNLGLPMMTDHSDLSDFAYHGDFPDNLMDPVLPRKQWTANWDKWVIGEIQSKYGIALTTTVIKLTDLFRQIEAKQTTPTLH